MIRIDLQQLTEMIENSTKRGMESITKNLTPNEPQNEELLTIDEVCSYLRCSKPTLWNWDRKNILKPIRIGRLVRYKKSQIENFINQRGNNPIF